MKLMLQGAMMQAPDKNGVRSVRSAIVRNTYGELRDTTAATFEHWYPEAEWGKFNRGHMTYTMERPLKDGTTLWHEILFRALDRPADVRHLLSLELTFAFFNEAREIPWTIIEAMIGRIDRWPSRENGPGPTFTCILMDTNPPDEDHWWFEQFEEKRPPGLAVYHQPGGLTPDAENLGHHDPDTGEYIPHLGPDYYKRLANTLTPDAKRVYVDGEYGFIRDGKPVYPEYSDSVMCREFDLWKAHDVPTIFVGLDFGLTPAAVLLQRGPMARVRVFEELVSDRLGAKQLAQQLVPVIQPYASQGYKFSIWGDPSGEAGSSIDHEQTVFSILRANGIQAQPCVTNDPAVRREAGRAPMMRMADGEPGLLIHPRCRKLRKALGGKFQYKRLQVAGDPRYHTKVDKNEWSHVAEAYEYGLLGAGENPKASIPTATMSGPVMPKAAKPWTPWD